MPTLPGRAQHVVNPKLVDDKRDYGESLKRWTDVAVVDARLEQTIADYSHDRRQHHVQLAQGGRCRRGERHVHVQLVNFHRRRGGQLLVERLSVRLIGAAGRWRARLEQHRGDGHGGRPEQQQVDGLQRRSEPVQAEPVRCRRRDRVREHAQSVAAHMQRSVKRCCSGH